MSFNINAKTIQFLLISFLIAATAIATYQASIVINDPAGFYASVLSLIPVFIVYAILSIALISLKSASEYSDDVCFDLVNETVQLTQTRDSSIEVKILSHNQRTGEIVYKTGIGSLFVGNKSQIVSA